LIRFGRLISFFQMWYVPELDFVTLEWRQTKSKSCIWIWWFSDKAMRVATQNSLIELVVVMGL